MLQRAYIHQSELLMHITYGGLAGEQMTFSKPHITWPGWVWFVNCLLHDHQPLRLYWQVRHNTTLGRNKRYEHSRHNQFQEANLQLATAKAVSKHTQSKVHSNNTMQIHIFTYKTYSNTHTQQHLAKYDEIRVVLVTSYRFKLGYCSYHHKPDTIGNKLEAISFLDLIGQQSHFIFNIFYRL